MLSLWLWCLVCNGPCIVSLLHVSQSRVCCSVLLLLLPDNVFRESLNKLSTPYPWFSGDAIVSCLLPNVTKLNRIIRPGKKGPAHWRDCGDISHVRKGHWFWEPQRDWGSAGRIFLLFAKWLGRVQAALSPCTHGWSRGLPYCGTKHSETLVILDKKETSLMVSNYTNIMQYFDYPGASV